MITLELNGKALTAAIARFGGDSVTRVLVPLVERRANEARRQAIQTFVSRGIGKGIFGQNNSGAYKLITLDPVTSTGGAVVAKLHVKGLAALQEKGGRIRPHTIKPKRAKVLAFADTKGFGFGGDFVFAKKVRHPGARVAAYPAIEPAAVKALELLLQDAGPRLAALWGQAAA